MARSWVVCFKVEVGLYILIMTAKSNMTGHYCTVCVLFSSWNTASCLPAVDVVAIFESYLK